MSRLIVLDTNCLVQIISAHSPYRDIWLAFLQKRYMLCVSDEILNEYQEILERHTTAEIAENVILLLLNSRNVRFYSPHFHVLEHIPFPTVKVIRLDEFQRTLKC